MRVGIIVSFLIFTVLINAGIGVAFNKGEGAFSDDNHEVFLPIVVKSDIQHSIEQIALIALYNSTDGANWIDNAGWGVGDPCDPAWYGVICFSDGVAALFLSRNQLSGSIPPELGSLSNLLILSLENNQLSGSIPPELGNLRSLGILKLDGNQLSGSIPAEFGNMSSLTHLDLTRNQLSGFIPPELGNASSLKIIGLTRNQLGGPIPAALSNLSSLELLFLNDNPDLLCWQTEEALNWAQELLFYNGPEAVCP